MLQTRSGAEIPQIVYYQSGVGTESDFRATGNLTSSLIRKSVPVKDISQLINRPSEAFGRVVGSHRFQYLKKAL